MPGLDFRSAWFAETITRHSVVDRATVLSNDIVQLERQDRSTITVAPLGNKRIDDGVVVSVLDVAAPTVILLVPKAGHYDWSAREIARRAGSSVLTMKELYTSLADTDPRPFLDKNVAYGRTRLEQHSRVTSVEMICEASMLLRREGALSNVVVAVEYEYEFTEEALVRAITRHPDADLILNSNPNGSTTQSAYSHARNADVPIYRLAELMGALNYDRDRLRSYEPPKRS